MRATGKDRATGCHAKVLASVICRPARLKPRRRARRTPTHAESNREGARRRKLAGGRGPGNRFVAVLNRFRAGAIGTHLRQAQQPRGHSKKQRGRPKGSPRETSAACCSGCRAAPLELRSGSHQRQIRHEPERPRHRRPQDPTRHRITSFRLLNDTHRLPWFARSEK